MEKYDIIVPITKSDLSVFLSIIPFWKEYLPIKEVILIGPESVMESLDEIKELKYRFINENEFINLDELKDIINCYTNGDIKAINRGGWYLQQFIKMQYSMICKDEYYMTWDSDTIPLHDINMINQGKPIFDMKIEYHQPYFDTLSRLFGSNLEKYSKSFISEHMLINCKIMREIIQKINSLENIEGKAWYEKIIRSINVDDIAFSGFSEFETYGTYTINSYPDMYEYRDWYSERYGYLLFNIKDININIIKWMGKEYDALSFEKFAKRNTLIKKILKYRLSRIINFKIYIKILRLIDIIIKN